MPCPCCGFPLPHNRSVHAARWQRLRPHPRVTARHPGRRPPSRRARGAEAPAAPDPASARDRGKADQQILYFIEPSALPVTFQPKAQPAIGTGTWVRLDSTLEGPDPGPNRGARGSAGARRAGAVEAPRGEAEPEPRSAAATHRPAASHTGIPRCCRSPMGRQPPEHRTAAVRRSWRTRLPATIDSPLLSAR